MLQTSKRLSAAVALVMLAINAAAVQKIEGADKRLVEVNVSANEPNRLVIGSGREVVNIIPSQKGAITTKVDDTNSAVYFSLTTSWWLLFSARGAGKNGHRPDKNDSLIVGRN